MFHLILGAVQVAYPCIELHLNNIVFSIVKAEMMSV